MRGNNYSCVVIDSLIKTFYNSFTKDKSFMA